MERSPFIQLAGIANVFLSIVIGIRILSGLRFVTHVEISEKEFHRFPVRWTPGHRSHTIAHSNVFNPFPMGTGREAIPPICLS
ncbi:MAG TPA: hypothetical protein VLA67_14165 [Nitrospiraceae bacterium]|nr:hypothetical protein [Nitrospiraceae bacterium]